MSEQAARDILADNRGDIHKKMLVIAQERGTITYSELFTNGCGLDMARDDHRNAASELLCDISTQEHNAGRPLLSAIVVHKEDQMPGFGFYELCKQLDIPGAESKKTELREAFFYGELKKVHNYWAIGEIM